MQGVLVSQAKVTPHGFELDRQWLLVKREDPDWKVPKSRYYSITKNVKVAEIKVEIEKGYLILSHPSKSNKMRIEINPQNFPNPDTPKFKFVTKGQREVEGILESEEISQWVSSIIGFDVVLVRGPNVQVNRNPVE